MSEQTIEEIAAQYPQVKELLDAYENCLEEIGNQRTLLQDANTIATSLQQTITGLITEVETLRPLVSMGLQMRQAQVTYYGMKSKVNSSTRKNIPIDPTFITHMNEWLVTSKINEKEFDGLLTKAVAFRDQKPPEPEQGDLL